jgi:hypothetical protein
MRNLDIADTRAKLRVYGEVGLLGSDAKGDIPLLAPAGTKKPRPKRPK